MKKIGHTGTLDPEAEGVLPVALGKGTRLVELLTKEKTYETLMRLRCFHRYAGYDRKNPEKKKTFL